LLSIGGHENATVSSYGAAETQIASPTQDTYFGAWISFAWKPAASAHGATETTKTNWTTGGGTDQEIVAIKYQAPISTSTAFRATVDTGSHVS
jgi:hypothetical protein